MLPSKAWESREGDQERVLEVESRKVVTIAVEVKERMARIPKEMEKVKVKRAMIANGGAVRLHEMAASMPRLPLQMTLRIALREPLPISRGLPLSAIGITTVAARQKDANSGIKISVMTSNRGSASLKAGLSLGIRAGERMVENGNREANLRHQPRQNRPLLLRTTSMRRPVTRDSLINASSAEL